MEGGSQFGWQEMVRKLSSLNGIVLLNGFGSLHRNIHCLCTSFRLRNCWSPSSSSNVDTAIDRTDPKKSLRCLQRQAGRGSTTACSVAQPHASIERDQKSRERVRDGLAAASAMIRTVAALRPERRVYAGLGRCSLIAGRDQMRKTESMGILQRGSGRC